MDLGTLGWDDAWQATVPPIDGGTVARVAVAHRGAVEVLDGHGQYWAEPTGKMFHSAGDARGLPIVGDWVVVSDAERARADGSRAVLRAILPRRTCLVRKAVGKADRPQPLVANVDVAFVLTSANLDLNPRRLERYLVAIRTGGATPVIVLSKIDLIADLAPALAIAAAAADGATVLVLSATRGDGVDELAALCRPGRTVAFLGSSGVGKTTLVNRLSGVDRATAPVRAGDDRGQHTTTRRELIITADHGVIVDTPGMRELALFEDPAETAFDDVVAIAAGCRFADCRHRAEPGCAVAAAVAAGALDGARVAGYQKLADEQAARERRNPSRKRR
ncbi:MAG: ribosome small subunit-dependent GTPase A [Myxococcales bacterium]|nr:ribosome small subunit-dependent GTPase A [Myxococcales bacterium]